MIDRNKKNLIPRSWSFRDIKKIFLRLKNQKIMDEYYREVGTAINLLFYALSSISREQLNEEVVYKLIQSLQSIFKEKINAEDLKNVYYSEAKLYYEYDSKRQIRTYYIQKHKSLIMLDKIDEKLMRKEREDIIKNKRKKLEIYSRLPNFLECLFKMKLANYEEPLLLSGPTCYKTYASKILLKSKTKVVFLNEESTISQLLGTTFLYLPIEDKKFCLRLILEILEIPNIDLVLSKADDWDNYQDEINNIIKEEMPESDSPLFIAIENLKKKLFSEEKTNEKSLINMKI